MRLRIVGTVCITANIVEGLTQLLISNSTVGLDKRFGLAFMHRHTGDQIQTTCAEIKGLASPIGDEVYDNRMLLTS